MIQSSLLPQMLLALIFATTGCVVGPIHLVPDSQAFLGTQYKNTPPKRSAAAPSGSWWRLFKDSGLDGLEEEVLAGNQELAQARARIVASRAVVRLKYSERFPTSSFREDLPGISSSRISKNGSVSSGMSTAVNRFPLLLDLNYEVDLWGRLRRGGEAAAAQSEAAVFDAENARLFLTVEAARLYYLHRSLEAEMGIARRGLEIDLRALNLSRIRKGAGLATGLEVAQQQAESTKSHGELSNLQRDLEQAFNSLAALSGKPPSQFKLSSTGRDFLSPVPSVPAGLPADLLNRRADIAAAERLLAARNAEIGVAIAAALPTINLTGEGGSVSSDVGKLFMASQGFGFFVPSLAVPLLDREKNLAGVKIAEAQHEEQISVYRQSILNAVQEVEDSLAALRAARNQRVNSAVSQQVAEQALRHATIKHGAGIVDQSTLLEVENRLVAERRSEIQAQAECYFANLQLIKTLGGGWKN